MKLTFKNYQTNCILFLEEEGETIKSFEINFDEIYFINQDELENYIREEISNKLEKNIEKIEDLQKIVFSISIEFQKNIKDYKQDFKKFLNENLKNENYNFDAYCEDLEKQYYNTGSFRYELSKNETKDKQTKIFDY